MVFTLLTLGILVEAAIFQVTSYIPPDNNIFFHSFAIVFILVLLSEFLPINFEAFPTLLLGVAGIMLWWSSIYWKFIEKYLVKQPVAVSSDVVNKQTYLIFKPDSTDVPMDQWRTIPLKSFGKMLLPGPTVDGINRLMEMDMVKNKKDLKVLNMSELTPAVMAMLATACHSGAQEGALGRAPRVPVPAQSASIKVLLHLLRTISWR